MLHITLEWAYSTAQAPQLLCDAVCATSCSFYDFVICHTHVCYLFFVKEFFYHMLAKSGYYPAVKSK